MGKKAHRFGIGYVLCGYKIYNNTQKHASYTSIRLLHLAFISSVFRTRLFFFFHAPTLPFLQLPSFHAHSSWMNSISVRYGERKKRK